MESVAKKKPKKNPNEFEVPRTELGRILVRLRGEYIASGGHLYTREEIQDELKGRRPRRGR